tara:strand:+ start:1264 stop:2727 length:1464 start_codon:yes stop_codon:yes gene_type:complete
MEVDRRAPSQVNYKDILPLAIPSSSNRRQFLPVNGSAFTPTGSNIIRIDINADSMLDTQHSYLQYTINNNAGGAINLALDQGVPWIQRLRIESGGVTLEDTMEYGRLYALLQNSQMSISKNSGENTCLMGNCGLLGSRTALAAAATGEGSAAVRCNKSVSNLSFNNQVITPGGQATFTVPLFSGLLNCEKYIPLILMNAGITIELTLQRPELVGVAGPDGAAGVVSIGTVIPDYSISDCRYVAHLVDLDRNFYDALRAEMAYTGSIAIHGQTWRHFSGNIGAGEVSANLNIPARMKSIKSIFSTFRQTTATDGVLSFSTSAFQKCGTTRWQYRIGSVYYPQASIPVANNNLAPTMCEVLKAFGKLGDVVADSSFSQNGFSQGDCRAVGIGEGGTSPPSFSQSVLQTQTAQQFCIGYDLEAFQRSALESGIDTANRALPISLEWTGSTGNNPDGQVQAVPAGGLTVDNYVVADAFFYVNQDGTATPST